MTLFCKNIINRRRQPYKRLIMNIKNLSEIIAQGEKAYNKLESKGARWKSRKVPIWIRNFCYPYLITDKSIFILTLPDKTSQKVYYRQVQLNENKEEV